MIYSSNCRNWSRVIYLIFGAIISTKLEVIKWEKIVADSCEFLWFPNSVTKLISGADDQSDGTYSENVYNSLMMHFWPKRLSRVQ